MRIPATAHPDDGPLNELALDPDEGPPEGVEGPGYASVVDEALVSALRPYVRYDPEERVVRRYGPSRALSTGRQVLVELLAARLESRLRPAGGPGRTRAQIEERLHTIGRVPEAIDALCERGLVQENAYDKGYRIPLTEVPRAAEYVEEAAGRMDERGVR